MKILFATNLNGRADVYELLVDRAEQFTAMFLLGDEVINGQSAATPDQHSRIERAISEIQARGCRVLVAGAQDQASERWQWLNQGGMFVTQGLLATVLPQGEPDFERLTVHREAAWSAGALWIVLTDSPPPWNSVIAGAPASTHGSPYAALRYAPDLLVVGQRGDASPIPVDWCEQRGHTWILTPGVEAGLDGPELVALDFRLQHVVRESASGKERRDMSGLFRSRAPGLHFGHSRMAA